MTYLTQRPKAKKELNFFNQQVEISTIDNGEQFILTVPLTKISDYSKPHNTYVQVSLEQYNSLSDAQRAIKTGDYNLPPDLKSYLVSMDVYANEGSPYGLTEPRVVESVDEDGAVTYIIAVLMEEHLDDAPNIISFHRQLSQGRWDSIDEAQHALDTGDWVCINQWHLTPYYLEVGSFTIEYNESREGYVYCRHILYKSTGEKDTEYTVDYLECSSQSYLLPEQARKALEEYLESI